MTHGIDVFVAEDAEEPEDLLQQTWEELQRRALPKYNLKIKVVDVDEELAIGDVISVRRDDIGLVADAQVTGFVMDKLADRKNLTLEVLEFEFNT